MLSETVKHEQSKYSMKTSTDTKGWGGCIHQGMSWGVTGERRQGLALEGSEACPPAFVCLVSLGCSQLSALTWSRTQLC